MKRAETSSEYRAELAPIGKRENSAIKISQPEFTIGRSLTASYILKDVKISRNHCIIRCQDGLWNISDESSQGTFVNGKKLTKSVPHCLKTGDRITLGAEQSYGFVFSVIDVTHTSFKKKCLSLRPEEVKKTANTASVLSHKQKQLQLEIEQTQHETSIMETEHLQLEADLQIELDLIDKKYEAKQASLKRRSASHSDVQKFEAEKAALEQQFSEEKEELVRAMMAQMEELQKKIYDKQQAELRLTLENQQLQEELQKERNLFKKRLEKEEEQVQLERRKVQELEQKHQQTIASLEEDYTIAGMLQEQEMAEKSKAYEEERKTIQSALLEKEKALEVTEEKLKKEGEVRSKFQDVLESELQCSICNELFVCAITLNCTHTFCQLCITQWKERKNDCPVCRAKIASETRMLLLDGFIDKAVENLSEEMKTRRNELVEEKQLAMLAYQQKPKASSSAVPQRNTRQNTRRRRAANRAQAETTITELEDLQDDTSIYISSSGSGEEAISLSDTGSDSSVEGEPQAYYGGYGYCYRCGRRGHWARGCPNY